MALAVAGCFTHPINGAPVVMSIEPIGGVVRGMPVMFRATGYDPDQDPLTLTWTWAWLAGGCPDVRDPSTWPMHAPSGDPLMETTTTVPAYLTGAPFCVWAFAKDRYGAEAANNLPVAPGNNPPVAIVSLTSPALGDSYPAYTRFQLSGLQSSDPDGDPLTYKWSFPDTQGTFIPCDVTSTTPDPDSTRCFRADLTAVTYTIGLIVSDSMLVDSPLTKFPLRVLADAPPCIAMSSPSFSAAFTDADPTIVNTISVAVHDDGDPFPNSAMPSHVPHFSWFTGKQGAPLDYIDNTDTGTLMIPANYNLTDTLIVRLEVRDRNMAVGDSLAGCDDSATFCASPAGSTCYQRVTWVINFDI
ncbi:MAG TPA: hypothetical protein VGP07_13330 [Polyangia bacterium]